MTSPGRVLALPARLRISPSTGRMPGASPSSLLPLLAAVVVGISVLMQSRIEQAGETPYREFLRLQWLLVEGGKGLHLDPLSLPLPPALFVAVAAVAGPEIAGRWLPVALDVAIALVLVRWLLRGTSLPIVLVAAALLIASPLFYLLQRQLDVQLFVLLLGLQLLTLRSFRMRPTVARVSAAIGVNILLSLTTYMALPALIAAIIYLLLLSERQQEVHAVAWRAMLWLYIPFSFTGYLLWAVYWMVAGSRVHTSDFIAEGQDGTSYFDPLLRSLGGNVAVPLLLLFVLAAALRMLRRSGPVDVRQRRDHALGWAALTFLAVAFILFGLQTVALRTPLQLEAFTFSLLLLIPTALAAVLGHAGPALRRGRWSARLAVLISATVVLIVFPARYIVDPDVLEGRLPVADPRQEAERRAAEAFGSVDPGGRILLDPRVNATFVRAAGIDPRRLLTPFDDGFEHLVTNPPDDVRVIVVTDSLDDAVAGNHPAGRIADLMPDATLIAQGRVEHDDGVTAVRVFRREHIVEPEQDHPFIERDPAITDKENRILMAVLEEMKRRGGLPLRPDNWAYAIDFGNLMVYAAQRGNVELFRLLSDRVRRDYLVTQSNDPNALYTVAWRHRAGRVNEASGTTETLRMVEAYWTAGERWDNDFYRRLAYLMARAYARHQTSNEFGEEWFIRNYYNYQTKAYATNTFLVDFAPDLLRRVAEYMQDPALRAVADKSAEFVAAAQVEAGLFHAMYQPEITTLYANITYFSPNGIIQMIDSIEAALGIAEYAPERAHRTFAFAQAEFERTGLRALSNQYLIDGSSTGSPENAPAVYAYLVRLGTRLGEDPTFLRAIVNEKLNVERMYSVSATPVADDYNWFFAWTSTLVALRDFQEGH